MGMPRFEAAAIVRARVSTFRIHREISRGTPRLLHRAIQGRAPDRGGGTTQSRARFDRRPIAPTCCAQMAAILEVTDLDVHRGRTAILRGVNWRVARGEHWVILGAN